MKRIFIATTIFFFIMSLGGKYFLYESWQESIIVAAISAVIWYAGMRVYQSKMQRKIRG